MTLYALVDELVLLGAHLRLALEVTAPRGTLTDDLMAGLSEHKPTLLRWLATGEVPPPPPVDTEGLARDVLWARLSRERWGPAVGDPTPGIVFTGQRGLITEAERREASNEEYARLEREAIQWESGECELFE